MSQWLSTIRNAGDKNLGAAIQRLATQAVAVHLHVASQDQVPAMRLGGAGHASHGPVPSRRHNDGNLADLSSNLHERAARTEVSL